MYPAGFRINQLWQPCLFSAGLDDLPGPVAVNAEDKFLTISFHRATALGVFREHGQCLTVDRQRPLAAVL